MDITYTYAITIVQFEQITNNIFPIKPPVGVEDGGSGVEVDGVVGFVVGGVDGGVGGIVGGVVEVVVGEVGFVVGGGVVGHVGVGDVGCGDVHILRHGKYRDV